MSTAPGTVPDVDWSAIEGHLAYHLADLRSPRVKAYALYRDYTEGRHRLLFATDKFRNAFGSMFREFADNLCPAVVGSLVDVLETQGWNASDVTENMEPQVGGPVSAAPSDDETAPGEAAQDAAEITEGQMWAQRASEMWDRERLHTWYGRVRLNGVREGDGYMLVWHAEDGPQRAKFHHQNPSTVSVLYDDDEPGRIARSAKVWRAGKRWRATIYYDDAVVRLASRGSSPGDGGCPNAKAFQPLVEADGWGQAVEANPYGRNPMFHYPLGLAGEYGRSLLADGIPIQDALNKSICDMLTTSEFHAYPQRWASGLETKYDDNGQEIPPFTSGADRLWTTPADAAKFGAFQAADLDPFLAVSEAFRTEMARVTGTPPSAFGLGHGGRGSTAPPSGTALKVAAERRTRQARNVQRDWGDTDEAAMALALLIEYDAEPPAGSITEAWADPAPVDEQGQTAALAVKVNELGVSQQQAQREMGYTPAEIIRMNAEREATAPAALDFGALPGGPLRGSDQQALGLPDPAAPAPPVAGPGGAPEPALA